MMRSNNKLKKKLRNSTMPSQLSTTKKIKREQRRSKESTGETSSTKKRRELRQKELRMLSRWRSNKSMPT